VDVFGAETDPDDARRDAAQDRELRQGADRERRVHVPVAAEDRGEDVVLNRDLERLRPPRRALATALDVAEVFGFDAAAP
jgi:hypothetical protein